MPEPHGYGFIRFASHHIMFLFSQHLNFFGIGFGCWLCCLQTHLKRVREEFSGWRFITEEIWWTYSQAHHCWFDASGNRGLLSELERVPVAKIQATLGSQPLTLIRGMWLVSARTLCLEGITGAKGHAGASVFKTALGSRYTTMGIVYQR